MNNNYTNEERNKIYNGDNAMQYIREYGLIGDFAKDWCDGYMNSDDMREYIEWLGIEYKDASDAE